MMGGGPSKDKKFVGKIIKQLLNGNKELFIVNDKDGTPTYTHDFAMIAKKLLATNRYGVYNCVCEGLTSRLEVAHEIVNQLGLEAEIKVTEVSSDYFSEEYFSHRPPSERLLNKKLELLGLNNMRPWKAALAEYISREWSGDL